MKFENEVPNHIYIFQVARKGWEPETQNFITKNFWDCFHIFRSSETQEPRKGFLAIMPKETKNTQGYFALQKPNRESPERVN